MASHLRFAVSVICLSMLTFAQSQFVGKWQTKASKVTGMPAITINIVESDNKFNGLLTLTNPDRTRLEMPILNPKVRQETLEFETILQGSSFHWRLTMKNGTNEGWLHGTDQRPSKGGQGGEVVIDERMIREHP